MNGWLGSPGDTTCARKKHIAVLGVLPALVLKEEGGGGGSPKTKGKGGYAYLFWMKTERAHRPQRAKLTESRFTRGRRSRGVIYSYRRERKLAKAAKMRFAE